MIISEAEWFLFGVIVWVTWERGAGGGGVCLSYTEADAYWLEIRGIERVHVIF